MIRQTTFLVVDDHPIFRQGLVALIESTPRYKVSAQAGSAEEAMSVLERSLPDIALVDISLVHQSGLDLVKTVRITYPQVLVLIVSMHDEVIYAARALKAGARGYVMKQEAASVLMDAIATVLRGRIYVSSTMRERLLETMFTQPDEPVSPAVDRLSDRELQVLELMGQGYGVAEIAGRLNLSVKTVNVYRDHLKENFISTGHGSFENTRYNGFRAVIGKKSYIILRFSPLACHDAQWYYLFTWR